MQYDETVVRVKKKYYVFSAVNVDRNGLILMRVYTARNNLIALVRITVKINPIVIDEDPCLSFKKS